MVAKNGMWPNATNSPVVTPTTMPAQTGSVSVAASGTLMTMSEAAQATTMPISAQITMFL